MFTANTILQYCENISEKWDLGLFQSFAKTKIWVFWLRSQNEFCYFVTHKESSVFEIGKSSRVDITSGKYAIAFTYIENTFNIWVVISVLKAIIEISFVQLTTFNLTQFISLILVNVTVTAFNVFLFFKGVQSQHLIV